MSCLTEAELQAVVDNEATEAHRAHAVSCRRCEDRITERRRRMATIASLVETEAAVPPTLEARLRHALASAQPVRGSTALRADAMPASWHRAGWVSALATAAVVVLVVFGVLPRFGAPTSLSASQILGRSLDTLSSARGVERLEYELVIAGVLGGPHRIEHLIDHGNPNRYRFANYGADGVLESAISQDPASRRRTQLIRVDGRNYIVNVTSRSAPLLPLPDMLQAQFEGAITMMQATSDQKLTILDAPDGREYVIEIPPVTPTVGGGIFDLYHARAVIDGRDFRIREFDATGTLLKQPYSVSFRLIGWDVRQPADVPATEFEIQAGPDDVVLEGETDDPVTGALATALRELSRVKGR